MTFRLGGYIIILKDYFVSELGDIMKKIMASKRILGLIMFVIFTIATISIALVVSAEDGSNSSSASSAATSGLSSSDVDKIVESLKVDGDFDALIAQMDELINRAILTGNTELQQYAEYVKQACELQKQLNTVNASISALKEKNSDITNIDKTVQENMGLNITIDDMQNILSTEAKSILKDVDFSKISAGLNDVPGIEEILKNPSSSNASQNALIEIILLQNAVDQELLEGEQITSAQNCINSNTAKLVSNESTKYTSDEYNSLKETSKEFESKGNKSASLAPSQVVLYNNSAKLSSAPIMYDNNILISIDDVIKFTKASVQYTEGTGNIAITTDKKLVEITKGSNVGYVNDSNVSTIIPVLTFKGVTYIPVEFFAKAFDVSYISIPSAGEFIAYSNLIQS